MKNSKEYTISVEESERIQILKIWFTIMVIFVHSYTEEVNFVGESLVLQVPDWLSMIKFIVSHSVSGCAVPGYFFISAVLLYKKEFTWIDNIKKKIKTLLIPYLIFNTVWIIIYFTAQQIAVFRPYFPQKSDIVSNWGIMQYVDAYLGLDGYPQL